MALHPGELCAHLRAVAHGPGATHLIDHAIDLDRGVSTHNEDEARLNRKMCEVAERIIVVTDSSKFNRSSLHKIIDTQRIDMIIVDEGIPTESLEGLRKSGIDVRLVKRQEAA